MAGDYAMKILLRASMNIYGLLLVTLVMLLLSVSHAWAQAQLTVTVNVSNNGEQMTVYGFVTNPSKQPVEGAQVSIQVDDVSGKTIHLALIYTDKDGYYLDQFKMPENVNGEFRVYVSAVKTGFERAIAQGEFTSIPEFSTLTFMFVVVTTLVSLMLRKISKPPS